MELFKVPILLRPYSARLLMLCSPRSHVSAADHATSTQVHTHNISSEKQPELVAQKTLPEPQRTPLYKRIDLIEFASVLASEITQVPDSIA